MVIKVGIWVILLAIPMVSFLIIGEEPSLELLQRVEASPWAAPVCFFLLLTDVLLPIPSSFVAVVSGQVLGTVGGGLLNWTAISLGHLVGFGMARRFGRSVAERYIGADRLETTGRQLAGMTGLGIILTRPIPVLAEAFSMHAGLTRYSAARMALLIGLGNIPHSFIYSWAGATVRDGETLGILIAAGVGVPTLGYALFMVVSARVRATPSGRK